MLTGARTNFTWKISHPQPLVSLKTNASHYAARLAIDESFRRTTK